MSDEAIKRVRLGVIHISRRDVISPHGWTHYLFDPWSDIEERDVEDLLAIRVKIGCECNGTPVRFEPAFATEEDIKLGKIKPVWFGQYGTGISAK